jgi:vitamin B12/bleomycin/antimicrobial peptide transport system ATP-binding/permease protein
MKKLNLELLKRIVTLAKPFWFSKEKWKARGLLGLLVLLLIADTQFNVYFNHQSGEFTSALAAGDGARFWKSVHLFFALLVGAVPVYAFYYFARDMLFVHWRRWLTYQFLGRYFEDHAFYRLLKNPAVDNPDQRIAEDVNSFTRDSLSFLILFGSAIFQLIGFGRILWSISVPLVFFLVLYAATGTAITFGLFGAKMATLYYTRRRREADFRFGLVRIRENAESIALYRGESQEQERLRLRFEDVFANFNEIIRVGLRLNLCYYSYNLSTLVLPALIIAPRVLSGELEVGQVVQATGAFSAILAALSVLVDNLENLSSFAAGVSRLDIFARHLGPAPTSGRSRIETREDNHLSLDHITLQTPDYEQTLIKDLTLAVPCGKALMIVGASGCGKSSLLRAIAGLWDAGSGTLHRPAAEHMLFLPQHPYMILGNLRSQLCYPNLERPTSDAELIGVLERVNLPALAERCGGLDQEFDFERALSVGERQRLAFARVLLNRPRYALLDEATSALDRENEAALYRQLAEVDTTVVSVSHHAAIAAYHEEILELTEGGGWRLHAAQDFRFTDSLE